VGIVQKEGVILSEKVKTKTIDGALCINTSALCEVLNVHRNTLAQWVKDGMPKRANGWYSLKDAFAWVMDNRGVKKKPGDDDEEMTLSQQKLFYEAKLKEQQAESATLKNDVSKGEYIKREEVVGELQRFFTTLRRSMAGYSRKVAMEISPYLDPAQVRTIEQNITDTTNEVLLQLSVRGVYDAKSK
jgi:phage terminase Nu1 subunit (DNA packaging protein)